MAPEPLTPAQLDDWRALINAHALVLERTEAALARADLPPLGWYDVLWSVYRAPGRRMRMHELARAVVMSRSGLTRLVDRLEAAGCLRREACANDGRGLDVTLTDEGDATLRRMWPVYGGAVREHFAHHLRDDGVVAEALAPVVAALR